MAVSGKLTIVFGIRHYFGGFLADRESRIFQ
jgi:hypothetical protein